MKNFKFPDYFDYPPFWTKQPNEEMFEKQVELWSSLICSFCKTINKSKIEINTVLDSPLFTNEKIKRRLSRETLMAILEKMEKIGLVRFVSERTSAIIFWISIDDWAKKLLDYANKYGNGPYTFYELVEGDSAPNRPFKGMDYETCAEVVNYLESQGKAIHSNKDKPALLQHGVKLLL
ncbi:Vacuolar protein-sorting-associated protein 25 [Tritrichomonas musculus]|uniref:Vacuolar protein-sorting-associated protein 25 n=1 Tax=Tritrichomonas musculus TaxID=1915356 RepID=A0ABR2L6A7_9EUKA